MYNEKIYAFSLVNLKNKQDAEGVVQEVFLHLWKDRARLKDVKNLDAWVFRLSFNVIRRRFRYLVDGSRPSSRSAPWTSAVELASEVASGAG